MLPLELEKRIINLPETDNHSIVMITSNDLRHKRFAYRLQKEFGDLILVWYELSHDVPAKYAPAKPAAPKQVSKPVKPIIEKLKESYRQSQIKLFAEEIEDLKAYSKLEPVKISWQDVHSEYFIDEIKKYNPYFFLTLGGPLYKKPLLDSIRGVTINQHAGHSPDFKGTNTTEWALYHRNLRCVSSTIHIITTGADAGPIFRRSNPCIFHKDHFTTVFTRIVALGTELMIEVVQDVIKDKKVVVFDQSQTVGRTYLDKHFDEKIITALTRDFDNNWLEDELTRLPNSNKIKEMKDGWYILNYHDVSWEESIYIRGTGGACPPDIFREHLAYLSKHGEFVSVQEGFDKYSSGNIKGPMFSFWFDEGLRGVRKYASPLLEKYNVKAAISVNSKSMTGKEMLWHFKLSFLSQVDGMRFLRSRLRRHGHKYSMPISDFVFDNFALSIIKEIDAVYHSFTDALHCKDGFRIFDDVEGIRELKDNGWLISNHTASHYPVAEDSCLDSFYDEFDECEEAINNSLNVKTKFWVLPFDRPAHRSKNLKEVFNKTNQGDRYLVLVGNQINKQYDEKEKLLYRIALPIISGKEMVEHLQKTPYHV